MPYRLSRHDASMQSALRRIACGQVTAAIAAIDDPGHARADTVHTVRKACKKVRGLLRLVRPGFEGFRAENAAFRDIARGVSGLRDADTLVATCDSLVARHADAVDAVALVALRHRLASLRRAAGGDAGDPQRLLARCRTDLVASAGRCAQWTLDDDGFAALRGGLRRSFAKARHAMREVEASPSDEALHDWRKRVKEHWYHARLLRPIWPGPMRAHARCAGELSEALGEHHDLAVFVQALRRFGKQRHALPVEALVALARARQQALATKAMTIGSRLLAPRPKALVRSWGACFAAWRDGC